MLSEVPPESEAFYDKSEEEMCIRDRLTTRRGNCYCYAAAFCALARGLGYDATAVAGTVGYARSPHGWVIMYDSEGTRIVYDVELEMAYIYDRGIENADFYALEPLRAYRWSYVYGEQFA